MKFEERVHFRHAVYGWVFFNAHLWSVATEKGDGNAKNLEEKICKENLSVYTHLRWFLANAKNSKCTN